MCRAVYIGTRSPAPEVAWDENAPAFNTQRLTDSDDAVRSRFRSPNVIYAGAHTGCSCGFNYGLGGATSDDPDEVAARDSVRRLRVYLEQLLRTESEIELFTCWEGEQGFSETSRRVIGLAHFSGESFEFVQLEFLVIQRPEPAG